MTEKVIPGSPTIEWALKEDSGLRMVVELIERYLSTNRLQAITKYLSGGPGCPRMCNDEQYTIMLLDIVITDAARLIVRVDELGTQLTFAATPHEDDLVWTLERIEPSRP